MEWEGRTIRRKAESDVDCLSASMTVSGSTHITLTVLAQSYVCMSVRFVRTCVFLSSVGMSGTERLYWDNFFFALTSYTLYPLL